MLKADIILPDDSQQTFAEEILEFNWSTRNNEGAGFSASIPILNASLKLCVVNAFTKNIVRGAKVIIYVDEGDLQLTLTVIEVSNLDRKSICEISCTGDFFTATNNVWGTLTIPPAAWAITQENYGLQMVESHTPHPEAVVSIRKKEDLALGLLWSYPERYNMSVTPFSTVDGKFSGNGVGIFKNTRPGQADPHAPVYMIAADQIIDYQIEAAQPPVTHLRTASLGKLAPTPQIPAISVYKHDTDTSIFTNTHAFYIEETQLSAVWTLSEDSNGDILTQTLSWSDGHTTIFPPNQYEQPLKIVGILQNAFVQFFPDSTPPRIDIIDRSTLNTIAQVDTGPTEDLTMIAPFGRPTAAKTNLIMSAQGHPLQILWLKTNTDGGGFALTAYKGNYEIIANPYAFTEQYALIEACKSTYSPDEYLCVAAYYTDGTQQLMPYIYINDDDEVDTGVYMYPPAATALPQNSMPVDVLVEELPYTANPGQVYALWLSPIGVASVTKLTPSETVVYAQWQYALLATPVAGKWIIAPDTVSPKFLETEMLWTGGAQWMIVKPDAVDQTTVAVLQRGNILEWAGTNEFSFIMSRSVYATAIYKGNNYWEIYLQIDANPFASRATGEPVISHKIADGPTNVIDLPFKVGALNQLDGSSWDEDRGRIELQIGKFYVRHGGATNFVLKDIAALNVIATSSYVEVFLDPRDAQPVTVKVTGFSINYGGAITAKLSGMIVDPEA